MADLYIGLMSGTSFDGVDAALVDFSQSHPHVIATAGLAYPKDLQQRLRQLISTPTISLAEFGNLDKRIAWLYIDAVKQLLTQAQWLPMQVTAIGSHGQTLFHAPPTEHDPYAFSLQIGDPSTIAKHCQIDVVADFRQADIALGGQGAPLAPAFHHAVFSEFAPIAILNLGGIANITLLENDKLIAYDTGPASTLMDAWINRHKGLNYDNKGAWAASGTAHEALLNRLLAHPYFKLATPKSTGFEMFNLEWVDHCIAATGIHIAPADVQATLLELTAHSITNALKNHPAQTLAVCGGGAHNQYLIQRLAQLSNITICTTNSLGIDVDWLEAVAFAWLAKQRIENKAGNACAVTGAIAGTVLGGIYSHQ